VYVCVLQFRFDSAGGTIERLARITVSGVYAIAAGSGAMRALWTTLPCHLASGRSRPWRTTARRMGAVAETVNLGIPRDSLDRERAGIDHVLPEATSDGHCALPREKLRLAAVKLHQTSVASP